jgi:hypothetical protein
MAKSLRDLHEDKYHDAVRHSELFNTIFYFNLDACLPAFLLPSFPFQQPPGRHIEKEKNLIVSPTPKA